MNSQLLYQQDPYKLEFDAAVIEIITLKDGRKGIVLDRTYFYPTGGGQEHDTGEIGSARVVDVYKDEENSRLVHVVEGLVEPGTLKVRIDAERRLRHMQHHTAQHLLTQCILRQSGSETVSANINGYSPSTLDILATRISKTDLEKSELLANQLIYENRHVKTYFVTPEELPSIPLRRPPKVIENIRIVEIDGFDYSPCGGTHVQHTGSIGLLKVLKAERQNDRIRVYFMAGLQALQVFQQMYDSLSSLANQMSMNWQDVPDVIKRQSDQLNTLQKEMQVLRLENIKHEASSLAGSAEQRGSLRLVSASFSQRPVGELRMLADELKHIPDLVSYLANFDGQKVTLLVTCGEASGKDARLQLTRQLVPINGRGGGDAKLAQGGGMATDDQYRTFLQQISLD
jgi:alanyl-tRNA synthetase